MRIEFPASAHLDAARAVAGKLIAQGHETLFVGGCVRDTLLGIPPKDYDIATCATPDMVARLFPCTVDVGARFGVMLVVHERIPVEVATFRTDADYHDGRHPETVAFSTPEEDVRRRDFTINGLLAHPMTGEVLDLVEGIADLRNKTLRAIGDPERRFTEDHLRMLRAVRFSSRFGFEIEPGTRQAILRNAPAICRVSRERVRDELQHILASDAPDRGFELLMDLGLLAEIMPGVARMRGVAQNPDFHPEGDVWTHTLLALSWLPSVPSPERIAALNWAVLLHDIGKPDCAESRDDGRITFYRHEFLGSQLARDVLLGLRLPTAVVEDAVRLIADHMRLASVEHMRIGTLRKLVSTRLASCPDTAPASRHYIQTLLHLLRIDSLACLQGTALHDIAVSRLAELEPGSEKPPALISGRDLKALGVIPGPIYRKLLAEVEEHQLNDELTTPEAAREFVLSRLRELGIDHRAGPE